MLLVLVGMALADVSPESGYEEDCLLEYYNAEHCEDCNNAASEELPDCPALAAAGKEYACQSYGASAWTEIWCDPGYTDAIGGPDETPDKDCSDCGGAGSAGFVAVGGGLLLMVTRRRRFREPDTQANGHGDPR